MSGGLLSANPYSQQGCAPMSGSVGRAMVVRPWVLMRASQSVGLQVLLWWGGSIPGLFGLRLEGRLGTTSAEPSPEAADS